MVTRSRSRTRIAVELPECASPRQHRELGAFARYCIVRLERELGTRESWIVSIKPALGSYASHVIVRDRGGLIEEQGNGKDGALATWDAMCRIEQRLREQPVVR